MKDFAEFFYLDAWCDVVTTQFYFFYRTAERIDTRRECFFKNICLVNCVGIEFHLERQKQRHHQTQLTNAVHLSK